MYAGMHVHSGLCTQGWCQPQLYPHSLCRLLFVHSSHFLYVIPYIIFLLSKWGHAKNYREVYFVVRLMMLIFLCQFKMTRSYTGTISIQLSYHALILAMRLYNTCYRNSPIVNTTGPAAPLKFYPLLPNSFLTTALTNTLLTHSQYLSHSLSLFLSALSGSSSPSFSSSSHFSRNALFSLSPSHLPLFSLLFYSLKSPAKGHECNKFNPINFHLCQSDVQLYSMVPSCVYLSKHKNPTTRLQSVVPSLALPPASSPISA